MFHCITWSEPWNNDRYRKRLCRSAMRVGDRNHQLLGSLTSAANKQLLRAPEVVEPIRVRTNRQGPITANSGRPEDSDFSVGAPLPIGSNCGAGLPTQTQFKYNTNPVLQSRFRRLEAGDLERPKTNPTLSQCKSNRVGTRSSPTAGASFPVTECSRPEARKVSLWTRRGRLVGHQHATRQSILGTRQAPTSSRSRRSRTQRIDERPASSCPRAKVDLQRAGQLKLFHGLVLGGSASIGVGAVVDLPVRVLGRFDGQ